MYYASQVSPPFGQLTSRARIRWKHRPKHIIIILIRSSGSDSERSPAVDSEAVLVSLSDSERSLAVLESFVSHRYIGLELTLTIPNNLVQVFFGSIGASLSESQDNFK